MVLKQRFTDGRTNYIDIGDQWMLIQSNAADFEERMKEYFKDAAPLKEDCIAFVSWDKNEEPIYKCYPQWIYSNDGQLFMTLTNQEPEKQEAFENISAP